MDLNTPYQFFKYLWTDEIISNIYEERKRYAIQKNPKHTGQKSLDLIELKKQRLLKNLKLLGNISILVCDNDKHLSRDHPNHDRLHKIRHLYDELNKNFAIVPLERHLWIDEQICSINVRHYMKQYLPIKPHKWGFKFFVLCGISDLAYKLEIHSGQENNEKYRQKGEPDLEQMFKTKRCAKRLPNQFHVRTFVEMV
ncbi:piggyBac transposable element-derived protein 1 [Trichonephila inaurata madagascariensis]|uniref:PiggyBac transposable element-derived protein 1 n=1 Tax=Trichonephila inaurata madagascariensis TaxID=2747483 RepID=A0A8X6XZW8_9ARAC|nr:piggyBac transposable element-derived protein 1 [Trichonephila inaurata madagascariensis]